MQSQRGQKTGICFIDTTPIKVCNNKRIHNHKVMDGMAGRGLYGAGQESSGDRGGGDASGAGNLFRTVGERRLGRRGEGRFSGKIHIAPGAAKSEGKQEHRALLLSDGAEVDCKPELEIFNDDVKCSHGAASGELDEEQLFYMESRGIARDEARRLLIAAYLAEPLEKIENPEIKEWLLSISK